MKSYKKQKKERDNLSGKLVKRDSATGRSIEEALNNTKYKARTIGGVAKEARVTKAQVVYAIKHDSSLRAKVKVFPRKSKDGRILITTKRRFSEEASVKDKFIDIFSTQLPELDDE